MEVKQKTWTVIPRGNSSKKFIYSRLHSLAGIVPLGLFLIEHFYSNATAMFGEETYNKQIEGLQSIPFLPVIEIIFIAIPLLFHAVYGIYLSFVSSNNTNTYQYRRNLMYLFQRISGIVTLIFVVYHVWSFRLSTAFTGTEVNFQLVSEHLQNPLIFAFYILGVVSTTYHFCNGLSTGLITWGITLGKNSQKIAVQLSLLLFAVMCLIGIATLYTFA
ncbi:succinate dehydrogenase cytochrome b558 subunit [Fictibacillus sp. WQ 8-8]|uniref:succinate dehydrogenase cytochrome b558 subunit n=1 Tax=Fictibacillus sp. WQ 8-8 TaxID=2938788 RepID=UPI00210E131C|nr:succinate dehydrogenase cytochrome b558 subunit [Fictibacillus sp. WQ 8-8]MCQ6268383.1 succinate dehydrogenase cytochrome b558 subunit [Fictibacillus sp. WQ 8-8]